MFSKSLECILPDGWDLVLIQMKCPELMNGPQGSAGKLLNKVGGHRQRLKWSLNKKDSIHYSQGTYGAYPCFSVTKINLGFQILALRWDRLNAKSIWCHKLKTDDIHVDESILDIFVSHLYNSSDWVRSFTPLILTYFLYDSKSTRCVSLCLYLSLMFLRWLYAMQCTNQ